MQLSAYSRNKVLDTFHDWGVPKDYADPMYNYLVYGFEPGSFFTSVLANDWHRAIMSSHPANTIQALKAVTGWIHAQVPSTARGSYSAVTAWCQLASDERRAILEQHHLVYSEKQENWMTLQSVPTHEPMLF